MNKKINTIINILIIVLIVALVAFMMSYYTGALDIPTGNPSNDVETIINNQSGETDLNPIISEIKNSGDTQNIETSNEAPEKNPNEIESENVESNTSNEKTNEEDPNLLSPVIITSENDISSKEKKEILTELDKTLMELLEVVDKVQTIDESRLITDDSEVQE